MTSSFFRQCIAYLLVALLPLQAAAASRLMLCAEMPHAPQVAAAARDHCAQMANAAGMQQPPDSAPHSHDSKSCWLGSICVASVTAFAMPVSGQCLSISSTTPVYPSVMASYRSIIPESPQRPPAFL
jgi:hypothetical protein